MLSAYSIHHLQINADQIRLRIEVINFMVMPINKSRIDTVRILPEMKNKIYDTNILPKWRSFLLRCIPRHLQLENGHLELSISKLSQHYITVLKHKSYKELKISVTFQQLDITTMN